MITPTCDICNEELNAFGAIILSPPDITNKVMKHHVCVQCYSGKIDLLLSAVPTPPEVEPVAWLYESNVRKCVSLCKDSSDSSGIPLFTAPPSPADDWSKGDVDADGNELITVRKDEYDELRKAAEEAEKFIDKLTNDYHGIDTGIFQIQQNLRAALNKCK